MLKRNDKTAENAVQKTHVDVDYWMNRAHEEMRKKKEKELDIDNWLFDSEEEKEAYYKRQEAIEKGELEDLPEEYYNYDWNDTPAAEKEEKSITEYNFLHGDYRHNQYYIYKQLVNISSLLSDIKEVLSDGNKAK